MTRHEKIDRVAQGFEDPGVAFDAATDGRVTTEEAQAVLRAAIRKGLESGAPAPARDAETIKAEGRVRLAALRGG
jgi:hypothetical protein